MKRLALSLVAAIALAGGFSHTSSAYDWTILNGASEDVYASTTRLPLVAIGDCDGDASCFDSCDDCCDCVGNWYDNTALFIASDAWANAWDATFPNNFGYRGGFNTGLAIIEGSPIRAQIGGSMGVYNLKGGFRNFDAHQADTQFFLTGGIYKRSNICADDPIAWGIVYDAMNTNNFGTIGTSVNLGQIRGIVGYAWDEANEFGVWAAFRAQDDHPTPFFPTLEVRAQDQVNGFWHHNWAFGGDTTVYSGWADDPGTWTFGASGHVPLNDNVALFGSTNYVIPGRQSGGVASVEEIWNVSFGLVFYFGGKAENTSVSGYQGLPLLPVADNGTFGIQF